MDIKKKKWGEKVFNENSNRYVVESALLGGACSAIIMNSFECIMYIRMAEQGPHKSILTLYKTHGWSLLTKGLTTRIIMSQGYALLQLNCLFYIGKFFNCDLLDEVDDSFLESLEK